MKRRVIVPLDSYELAKYSVQVKCVVCGGENAFDAERCQHCCAPMSITQRAAEQKRNPPKFVASLGASGSGKTVFLAMMIDILSRHPGDLHLLARGAFSVGLQRQVVQGLQACCFPRLTPTSPHDWSWMYCQLKRGRKAATDMVIPDFSGAAISRELEQPRSQPVIRAFLRQCRAAIVFVDAARLAQGDADPDYETMKTVGYLSETRRVPKRMWGGQPVAVVFTKADKVETDNGPEQFAKEKAPGLYRHCVERLPNHRFFFASVAGQTLFEGEREIPLRVEPRGVAAPMAWLTERI
jgi:hypothetical protein